MARKKMVVNNFYLVKLKEFIRRKTDLLCDNNRDIKELSSKIRASTSELLSTQTLKRVFGLIRSEFTPSTDTLNILSSYVGYDSFDNFKKFNKEYQVQAQINSPMLNILIAILNKIDVGLTDEDKINLLVENILVLIERDPILANQFYEHIASKPFGRKYFYRLNPNIDALNTYFGHGLTYFILYATNKTERLYAYCMLCFKYFLNDDREKFIQYFEYIKEYDENDLMQISSPVLCRYYATLILASSINNNLDTQLPMIQNNITTYCNNNNPLFVDQGYLSIIVEALVLTDCLDEAYHILGRISIKINPITGKNYNNNHLKLLALFIDVFTDKIKPDKAQEKYNKEIFCDYNKLSLKYYTIFDKIIQQYLLQNKTKKDRNNLFRLIDDTGFRFFLKFYQNYASPCLINGY
jgi:hypothetical protein